MKRRPRGTGAASSSVLGEGGKGTENVSEANYLTAQPNDAPSGRRAPRRARPWMKSPVGGGCPRSPKGLSGPGSHRFLRRRESQQCARWESRGRRSRRANAGVKCPRSSGSTRRRRALQRLGCPPWGSPAEARRRTHQQRASRTKAKCHRCVADAHNQLRTDSVAQGASVAETRSASATRRAAPSSSC
jgi:hypothetical protein